MVILTSCSAGSGRTGMDKHVIAVRIAFVSSRGTKCRGDLVHIPEGTVRDCFAALAIIT